MDDGFIALPLAKRQIDQAFALVRAAAPDLRVERWRAFAASLVEAVGSADSRCGIMTAQNDLGYIHGLFTYCMTEHLHHGRVLVVENFIVLDLVDVSGAAEALLRAMDGLARAFGCSAVHTSLPESRRVMRTEAMMACFRGDGHSVEALRLCKHVEHMGANVRSPTSGNGDSGLHQ